MLSVSVMASSAVNLSSAFLVCVWLMCYCVDPDLVYDKCLDRDDGFENALDLFPAGYRPTSVQPEMSGVLLHILHIYVWQVLHPPSAALQCFDSVGSLT